MSQSDVVEELLAEGREAIAGMAQLRDMYARLQAQNKAALAEIDRLKAEKSEMLAQFDSDRRAWQADIARRVREMKLVRDVLSDPASADLARAEASRTSGMRFSTELQTLRETVQRTEAEASRNLAKMAADKARAEARISSLEAENRILKEEAKRRGQDGNNDLIQADAKLASLQAELARVATRAVEAEARNEALSTELARLRRTM